jgi:CTP:molybdopterin cytidylyltransferase MocA
VTVAGLLLGAGAGTRLGGPKALVEIGGELLIERGARLLHDGGCDPVVVVVGAAADEVVERADLTRADVVVNLEWATGMGSSLRMGIDALPAGCEAVVVALADQPLVRPVAIGRLVDAWRGGAVAAVAQWDGRLGNPVLLDAVLLVRVRAEAVGDVGARRFLRRHPELVTPVDCDGAGAPDDIDTPADLTCVTRCVVRGEDARHDPLAG